MTRKEAMGGWKDTSQGLFMWMEGKKQGGKLTKTSV